jgi:hypothetical protein
MLFPFHVFRVVNCSEFRRELQDCLRYSNRRLSQGRKFHRINGVSADFSISAARHFTIFIFQLQFKRRSHKHFFLHVSSLAWKVALYFFRYSLHTILHEPQILVFQNIINIFPTKKFSFKVVKIIFLLAEESAWHASIWLIKQSFPYFSCTISSKMAPAFKSSSLFGLQRILRINHVSS